VSGKASPRRSGGRSGPSATRSLPAHPQYEPLGVRVDPWRWQRRLRRREGHATRGDGRSASGGELPRPGATRRAGGSASPRPSGRRSLAPASDAEATARRDGNHRGRHRTVARGRRRRRN
jgi:hypothetical protein